MTLTKNDLQAIDNIVVKRTKPLEKKFDELFNFLDREHSKLKTEVKIVQEHLHLPTLDF